MFSVFDLLSDDKLEAAVTCAVLGLSPITPGVSDVKDVIQELLNAG